MKNYITRFAVLPIALLAAGSVFAQGLEEIVVTATKRETTEMDAALSLEAFTGEHVEKNGLANLADITMLVPNVHISEGYTAGSVNIRGMGSGTDRGFEQSVALFVDEVYNPRSRQYRVAFFDMDRIEVLRGPQSVLFGLNATAGTVSITSAKNRPGDEFETRLFGGYETEYSGYEIGGIIGGGIGDNVGLRLAARYTDTGDGYYTNEFSGEDEGNREETIVRGSGVFQLSDAFSLTAKLEYAESDQFGDNAELYGATAAAITGDGEVDWVRNSEPNTLRGMTDDRGFFTETMTALLRADYDFENHTLSAIAATSDADAQMSTTILIPIEGGAQHYIEEFSQDSVEFRLASTNDSAFSYLLGAYWSQSDNFQQYETNFGPLLTGTPGIGLIRASVNNIDNEVVSLYASATYEFTDRFRLTGGLRYVDEDKSSSTEEGQLEAGGPCGLYASDGMGTWTYAGVPFACTPFPTPSPTSRSSSNTMPELIAQYDFNDSVTSYFRYGESVKSGGFATSGATPLANREYDDEKATTLELGLKSRFMDGRAELNVAVFSTEFEDLQVNTFVVEGTNVISGIDNAAKVTSDGVEIEFNILPTDWLTLSASVGFLDATYDEYTQANCYVGETPDDPVTGGCDKSGQDTPFSPENSGSLSAAIDVPMGGVRLVGGVTVGFSSDYFTEGTLDPAAEQSSYERWDARIGIADDEDRWSISLIGKNLGDEAVVGVTQPLVGYVGFINEPSTLMLRGTMSF
jgi:iron complex outermembrane receptor protein